MTNAAYLWSIAPARLETLLTESDRPFGDRCARPQQSVNVENVEAVTQHHDLQASDVGRLVWRNLSTVVAETQVGGLFPRSIRGFLAAS